MESLTQTLSERLMILSLETLVLAAVVWLAARWVRSRSARLAALLWMLVLLKPLAGLVFGAPVVVHHWTEPEFFNAEPDFDALLFDESTAMTAPPTDAGVAPSSPSNLTPQAQPATAAPPALARAHWSMPSGRDLLLLGWLVGAFAVLVWWAWGRIGLRSVIARARRFTQAHPAEAEPLRAESASVARSLGLRHAPPVYLSDELESPALAGCLSPVVLLPAWMGQADQEMVRWALRHELVHYKHGDPWFLGLRQLACVAFFFHPLVWWAGRRWEEAAELACDRALLGGAGDARAYAKKLYGMLEHAVARRKARLAGGLFATRTQLGKRIAALLGQPLAGSARLGALATLTLLLVSCIVLTVGSRFVQAAKNDVAMPEPAESAAVVPPSATAEIAATTDEFLASLLKLKAETGRDNALIYYQQAGALGMEVGFPGSQRELDALQRMAQTGWTSGCEVLLPRIERYQKVFERIVDGATVENAEFPDENSYLTPEKTIPNFLHSQINARMLRARSYWRFSRGETGPATEDGCAVLRMGAAFYSSNAPLTAVLVGISIETIGSYGLSGLVSAEKLDANDLRRIAAAIDDSRGISQPFGRVARKELERTLAASTNRIHPSTTAEVDVFYTRQLPANLTAVQAYFDRPAWNQKPDDLSALVESKFDDNPLAQVLVGNLAHVGVRMAVNDARLNILATQVALAEYRLAHKNYPDSLDALSLPAGTSIDPFSGKPLKYEKDKASYHLYSVGPDGESQTNLVPYDPTNGLRSVGDIAQAVMTPAAQQPASKPAPAPAAAATDEFLASLRKLKAETGRDNALIYHQEAALLAKEIGIPRDNATRSAMQEVSDHGWTPACEPLVPWLERYQPIFTHVREGALVGEAEFPENNLYSDPFTSPVPNFLTPQIIARMLRAEGYRQLGWGIVNMAADDGCTALRMGAAYDSRHALYVSSLLSVSMQEVACRLLSDVARSDRLDGSDLQRILAAIEYARRVAMPYSDVVREDLARHMVAFPKLWAASEEEMRNDPIYRDRLLDNHTPPGGRRATIDDVVAFYTQQLPTHHRAVEAYFDQPYWKQDAASWKQLLHDEFDDNPAVSFALRLYPANAERFAVLAARMHMLETQVALAARRQGGNYPESLDGLPLRAGASTDPFTGKPLHYRVHYARTGSTYDLYSVGPDGVDQSGSVPYDPTNGIRSAGDIALDEPPAPPQSRTEDALPAATSRYSTPPTAPSPAPIPAASIEDALAPFRELKAKTGRDNSLLYYFQAAALPIKLTLSSSQVLDAPADAQVAAEQRRYFEQCQPAFTLLRMGAKIDQAEWPPLPGDWEPRNMPILVRATAIIGEGKAFFRGGEIDKALANLIVPAVVGDHLCSPGVPFMPYLMGIAVRTWGVHALDELVQSGKLSEAQLSTVAQLLAHVDRAEGGMAAVIKAYTDVRLAKLEPALRQKRLADFFADRYEGLPGIQDQEMEQLRTLEAKPDVVLKYEQEWKALCDARLATPYEKREPLNWFAKVREAESESGLPLARLDFAWEHADVRDRANLAELRNLRVIVAAERFKLKLGDYPSRPADLVPAYLDRMPNDPFTGKPLH